MAPATPGETVRQVGEPHQSGAGSALRRGHVLRIVIAVLTALTGVACGGNPPSTTPLPVAASYDDYRTAVCAAWEALFRAVGNPDTASGSDLSRALDTAVTAGDVDTADRIAGEIAKELRDGRDQIAVAGGWSPRTAVTVQMDRMFAAFGVMIEAKRASARHEPNAVDPQIAFEQAGGVEAWHAMFEAARNDGAGTAGATERPCENVPVTP